ncbi:mCG1051082 [Mus musculus]|nr:mCG1051082 [Mus musculus]
MLSHSDLAGASVAQKAWCQDSEPALVPQRYPSASVSPENTSLYFGASTEVACIRAPALLPGISLCLSFPGSVLSVPVHST